MLVRGGIVLSGKSIDRVDPPSQGLGGAVRGNSTPDGSLGSSAGGGRRNWWWAPGGVLVQVDSKRLSPGTGKVVYHFSALDCFTCEQVVILAPRLTSA